MTATEVRETIREKHLMVLQLFPDVCNFYNKNDIAFKINSTTNVGEDIKSMPCQMYENI